MLWDPDCWRLSQKKDLPHSVLPGREWRKQHLLSISHVHMYGKLQDRQMDGYHVKPLPMFEWDQESFRAQSTLFSSWALTSLWEGHVKTDFLYSDQYSMIFSGRNPTSSIIITMVDTGWTHPQVWHNSFLL